MMEYVLGEMKVTLVDVAEYVTEYHRLSEYLRQYFINKYGVEILVLEGVETGWAVNKKDNIGDYYTPSFRSASFTDCIKWLMETFEE